MPRRPRVHLPHGFYHVTLRGNHQRDIFFAEGDRSVLNGIVARVTEKYGVRVHAYCWMTNHLHLALQAGPDPLAEPMRQIASEYARSMQSRLRTTGHFFERRYHAVLVDSDSYLLELVRYIHLNPVKGGVVESPGQYRWSSHHAYVGSRIESWVATDFVLRMFSEDRARAVSAYCAFISCEQSQSWAPPDESAHPSAKRERPQLNPVAQGQSAPKGARETLSGLIAEACRRFEVNAEHLASPIRDPYLTKVRAWIAHQAKVRRVATLAAVARQLGRDEATLRESIRKYPEEVG